MVIYDNFDNLLLEKSKYLILLYNDYIIEISPKSVILLYE